MSRKSHRKLAGVHFRYGNRRDGAIMLELEKMMAAGATQAEAMRRLWEDGIKWRKERG